jgi:hypothetical protein
MDTYLPYLAREGSKPPSRQELEGLEACPCPSQPEPDYVEVPGWPKVVFYFAL